MDTYYCYEKVNGHWVTFDSTINRTSSGTFIPINCKNNGATALTFNITVSFTNALFSAKTPSPHHQINHTAACFTFTLQIGEKQSAPVYFLIDETFAHFTISLNLQSNLYVESANDHDFSGYRQLYYIWVPERHTYSPILA